MFIGVGLRELELSKLHVGIFDWFGADFSELFERERSRRFRVRSESHGCGVINVLTCLTVSHCFK